MDDSLFDRSRSKNTELLAKVFDHCPMKFKKGYRMLTLGWSDGNSFIPVDYCLLSAAGDKNLLCNAKSYDGRSLAGKRRRQSRRKATDVMMELIASAQAAGITAKYVLFDSWFSSPKAILALKKERGLDTVAMVKKSKASVQLRKSQPESDLQSKPQAPGAFEIPAVCRGCLGQRWGFSSRKACLCAEQKQPEGLACLDQYRYRTL